MLTYSYGFASDYSLAVELHHVGRCNLAGQHVVLEDGRLSVGLVPRPGRGDNARRDVETTCGTAKSTAANAAALCVGA
jgi:hypothetical protein